MTIIKAAEATIHEVHGSRFTAYVAPSSGSAELCAWRVEVPASGRGVAHRVSREEVFAILSGDLEITVDGITHEAQAGDVVLVRSAVRGACRQPPWRVGDDVGHDQSRPHRNHGRRNSHESAMDAVNQAQS